MSPRKRLPASEKRRRQRQQSQATPSNNQRLDDTVIELFKTMRMTAFGQTIVDIANDPAFDDYTFAQKINYALDKEVAARRQRRIANLMKASQSPNPNACIEEIRYLPDRSLNRESIARLAHCQWIDNRQNLILLGGSSVGKTYIAQALLNAACRNEYGALFYRLDDLLTTLLSMDDTDKEKLQLREQLIDIDLLVLDDFLTTPVTDRAAKELLPIIAGREGRGSTLVTSQIDPGSWHESFNDQVICESILNRIAGGAETHTLTGPNLRMNPIT